MEHWKYSYIDYNQIYKNKSNFGIKRRIETIQTIALLKPRRIFRRVLESWENLLSSGLQSIPPFTMGVKNSQGEKNDNDTIYQPLRSGRIWHKVNF